jgi:hypothetical protein
VGEDDSDEDADSKEQEVDMDEADARREDDMDPSSYYGVVSLRGGWQTLELTSSGARELLGEPSSYYT